MNRRARRPPSHEDGHGDITWLEMLLSSHRAQVEAGEQSSLPAPPYLLITPATVIDDNGERQERIHVLKIEDGEEGLLWEGSDREGAAAVASLYGLPVVDYTQDGEVEGR